MGRPTIYKKDADRKVQISTYVSRELKKKIIDAAKIDNRSVTKFLAVNLEKLFGGLKNETTNN